MLTLIVGGLGFGFALMALVLIIAALCRGKRALSGQVVPLQQIHEVLNPGMENTVEVVEEKQTRRDESGDTNA